MEVETLLDDTDDELTELVLGLLEELRLLTGKALIDDTVEGLLDEEELLSDEALDAELADEMELADDVDKLDTELAEL